MSLYVPTSLFYSRSWPRPGPQFVRDEAIDRALGLDRPNLAARHWRGCCRDVCPGRTRLADGSRRRPKSVTYTSSSKGELTVET